MPIADERLEQKGEKKKNASRAVVSRKVKKAEGKFRLPKADGRSLA